MSAALLMLAESVVQRAVDTGVSPYPPSFDGNPIIFAFALFARVYIVLLSAATLVRIASRNRAEGVAANHPVYYHRMTVCCFLWGALDGAGSDVLTYLFWNEVTAGTTATILMVSKFMDASTIVPFTLALSVPLWLGWLCRRGVIKTAPSLTLNGVISDVRATWTSASVPLTLLAYSVLGSAGVTVGKYWLWLEHGHG